MFRLATRDDAVFVSSLEDVCFGRSAWSEALVAGAIDAGQVVLDVDRGYVAFRVVDEIADLDRIAVAPNHRRAGRGRALLDESRRLAAAAGAEQMILEVAADNSAAIAMYTAAGFVEVDRRAGYYGYGVDAVVMSRPLG